VYRITDRGEVLFQELLEEAGADATGEENRFRVRLAFFKYLAPESRIRVLERRRAFLEERLATLTASLSMHRDTYTLSLMEHGRETTEQDIAWLTGLIAAERRTTESISTGVPKRRGQRALRRKEHTT
jgi:hypothetical protein